MQKARKKSPVSTRHAESIRKVVKLVESIVAELEGYLHNQSQDEESVNRWKYIFGDKENIVSSLTKLTGILVKIIPMEQDIMKVLNKDNENKVNDISEEDVEIIKRYLEKVRNGEERPEIMDLTGFKFSS